MKITRLLTAAILASSVVMSADEGGSTFKPYAAFGFSFAQGHAHDLTQKTWGGLGAFAAEMGLQFNLPMAPNLQVRPNFGLVKILGDEPTEDHPKIYDLMGIYLGFDLVYAPVKSLPNLSVTTGPSFHTWNVDEVNAIGDPNQGDKGMKFGWRLGLGYDINEKFRVTLDFTLTEWRSLHNSVSTTLVEGFNPSRPAYFTLKASYSF